MVLASEEAQVRHAVKKPQAAEIENRMGILELKVYKAFVPGGFSYGNTNCHIF